MLALSAMGWCAPEISAGPAQSGLRIQSVEFEPVGAGKNVVHVSVANPTAGQKRVAICVQTHTLIDWDSQCFTTVNAGETRKIRCAFSFIGPVADVMSIRLRFYETASATSCGESQFFQQQLFSLTDLPLKTPTALNALPASGRKAVQVTRKFQSFQRLLRSGQYRTIWDTVFSSDYRDAGFRSRENFAMAMTGADWTCLLFWDRDLLLGMRPVSVGSANDLLVLAVTNGKETWHINFTPAGNGWRIDWIGGYKPAIFQLPNKDDRRRHLLAATQTFNTRHFEIHYYTHSTAERELSALAQSRELGYAKIMEFLGISELPGDRKITLFFFEDMKTKFLDTGYIGLGYADGDIIGEVYNNKQRCDPYHELTHILIRPYGLPPAILNEGVAVYMSERLGGAHPLRYLGAGDQALYAQVRDFKRHGDWISFQELLTYREIGSQGDRTLLAYIETGAFVKYLVETYGKEKFLEAFKRLTNTEDPEILRRNQTELERIYGVPVQQLEEDWVRSCMSARR